VKINIKWLHLFLGILCIFLGGWVLLNTRPDPLRDAVRTLMEIVPFVVMVLFGILLSISSVRKLIQGEKVAENNTLNTATKTFGMLTTLGIGLFLIPIIFLLIVVLMWVVN
jgi:hypothetical protein